LSQVFQLWLKAAQQGNAEAHHIVGDFYLRGVGTEASVEEARRWLGAAALQRHVPAMVLLGGVLLQQSSHATDQPQAADLFRRAAALGDRDAQYNFGVCLRRGLGVARDDLEAEKCYQAAARQGHSSAQLALGSLKAQNARAAADWIEVAAWYRLAAEAGHPTAMMALASLHESGQGVAVDRGAALKLYRQALAAGLADAAAAIQRIEAAEPRAELAS
jgi:TPR repeat protein